jgi:8-oxo-dGTP diphosphatase
MCKNREIAGEENGMPGFKLTTLCHLERSGCYLMLHRVKKEEDVNQGKWIGVGGKFEQGEAPEECLIREVYEETGFRLTGSEFRGILTFIYDHKDPEYIFVYTSKSFETDPGPAAGCGGEKTQLEMPLPECDEGIVRWVPKEEILQLELWEGDRYMLEYLLKDRIEPFSLKLCYDAEDRLIEAWEMSAAPVRLK